MIAFVAEIVPVLVFLLSVTLVAEIADRAGVFDRAGYVLVRLARGRVWALWLGMVVLAFVTTTVLSLDTTAVLLTPVAIVVARQAGVPALPFAATTVWLANTGSLLLPVSNLSNMLAAGPGTPLSGHFAQHTWAAAVTAVVVTAALVLAFWPGVLRGRFDAPERPSLADPVMQGLSLAVIVGLCVCFGLGLTPAWPTLAGALVLLVAARARSRGRLTGLALPWGMALAVLALFAAVAGARVLGLDAVMRAAVGTGRGFGDLLRVGGVGAAGSNIVNNLPAFLALQNSVGDSPARTVALLVGVNAGSIVTPWGSLATLLWLGRCRSAGLTIRLGPHILRSAVVAVVVVTAAIGVLALTG